jgi:uncharacterized damage-inducible protein DinB
MSSSNNLEVWQRGPIADVPSLLQPVAHALVQAAEDVEKFLVDFPDSLLWERPQGVASVGFHLQHLTGVVDRLFTYAKAEPLLDEQLKSLSREGLPDENIKVTDLVLKFQQEVDKALAQLKQTNEDRLLEHRGVGRKQIPSTVIGLLFHAAEHSQRHVGQLLVTAKILQGQSK